MKPHTFKPGAPLSGNITVPGDKSISHRALMLSALAVGESRISGLLEGEDVIATAAALRALGAQIARDEDGLWRVHGVGVGGLLEPTGALDMGNSGTSTRLLAGLIASHGIRAVFIGDASLSRRPMRRIIEPLAQMGASFEATRGDCLPLVVTGAHPAVPIRYRLPVASAQVKSAILLAALNTPGVTRVIETEPTRDHTERMLKALGAPISIESDQSASGAAREIAIEGPCELAPARFAIPGDPSSAAFFITAALLVPGSDIVIENVGLNPTRTGLIEALRAMGASIEELNPREIGAEPVADLRVRHSMLEAIDLDPRIAPRMIDEFPCLFVAAALARGTTRTRGLAELRVKESDRLAAMASALSLAGARVEEHEDGLTIEGTGGEPLAGTGEGAAVETRLDHRIAMSMAIAGLASRKGVRIDDSAPIATSFPGFLSLIERFAA